MTKIIVITVVCVGVFWLWARTFERRSMFFPWRELEGTPRMIAAEFEDVWLTTADNERIHGWFIDSPVGSEYVILFCHGNGGNISHRLSKLQSLLGCGPAIFIYDYRGYGQSSGVPSEQGMTIDTLTAYEYLTKERNVLPAHIVAYGESLGGAVAIELASQVEVGGLIIESTFTSVADMARRFYPFFPPFLIQNKFDSLEKIGRITVPKLFFHSPTDDVVPFALGQRLYEEAPEPKAFVTTRGDHNEGFSASTDITIPEIQKFLQSIKQ